jgi:hypothetical protein
MNTLHLTIPQLADLRRTQFTADERQKLAELMLEQKPQAKKPKEQLPSVAEDLREAFIELKQYQKGEIQLPTMQEFLDEFQQADFSHFSK